MSEINPLAYLARDLADNASFAQLIGEIRSEQLEAVIRTDDQKEREKAIAAVRALDSITTRISTLASQLKPRPAPAKRV